MKKLIQEDDLTIINEYSKNSYLDISDILTFTFMIVLYYSGYARWFFWFLFVIFVLYTFILTFNNIKSKNRILKDEIERRGYVK